MKSLLFFGIIYLLLLPLMAIACDKSGPAETIQPTPGANVIELTLGDFSTENYIVKNVEMTNPGSFTLRLGSNPSTGYEWDDAIISAPDVIVLASTDFAQSKDTKAVGSAGTDVRVFKTIKAGTATIKLSYGRPWEGGEKDTYTLTINVTVK